MSPLPISNYPPGCTQAEVDESAGLYPSREEMQAREEERGDMKRDREVDE